MQMTPVTQTSCLAYRLAITQKTGKNASICLYGESRGQANLSLETSHGVIAVAPCELHIKSARFQDRQDLFKDFSHVRSHALLTQHGIAAKNAAGLTRSITLSEFVLQSGDSIYLTGEHHRKKTDPHPEKSFRYR